MTLYCGAEALGDSGQKPGGILDSLVLLVRKQPKEQTALSSAPGGNRWIKTNPYHSVISPPGPTWLVLSPALPLLQIFLFAPGLQRKAFCLKGATGP